MTLKRSFIIAITFFIFFSCKKDNFFYPKRDFVSIFYMAGNNNLREDIENAVIKLQKGYTDNEENKILVYLKTDNDTSKIIEIAHSEENNIKSRVIKKYLHTNSSDLTHFKEVMNDVKNLYPSNQYSLILSSHATSWFPPKNKYFKSFGLDQQYEMEIKDLKKVLGGIQLEYIVFDACYMSSIEVLYELKGCASYVISSPSEVISYGFPYERIANLLFDKDPNNLRVICDEYVNFYENLEGNLRSANVSLVNMSELTNVIIKLSNVFQDMDNDIDVSNVQDLVFDVMSDVEAYDLLSFFKYNATQEQVLSIKKVIDNMVLYRRTTEKFNGSDVIDFCGVSIYFPLKHKKNMFYNNYYKTYSFYKDSGIYALYNF